MAVDLPVMDGGGGSAIANGLHVLIPCKSTFQWHTGVFHGRSTLTKRIKIKMKERKKIASAQDAGVLDMSDVPVL